MTWIVDASVAVKWVIPEVLSEPADRVRASDDDLVAPDLLLVEVANTLWKKTVAREITTAEADVAFELIHDSGIDWRPTTPLLSRAREMAGRLDHPVHDCVYLALAEREQGTFVTADRRLLRKVAGRKLAVPVVDLRSL